MIMTDRIEISVDQIRDALLVLLNHVRDNYGDTFELSSDYFWSIPDAAKFDVYNKPEELTIGQISEICDHLAKLATSPKDVATYQLRWFAQLFDAIAHDKAV
ncbi:MAG: hypothetical protein ACRDR6_21020 [Pseudonocardiaceae bacterium]